MFKKLFKKSSKEIKPQPPIEITEGEQTIRLPQMSESMTKAKVTKWYFKEGDIVKAGDVLAEIETDKAVMELESYDNGQLVKLAVQEGEWLKVNDVLAVIETV
ncbi:biotin/lipoyl-containing protein [Limibacter armeniacum]|uniref:biotin/lipoyl-containing protein n=1 Tax=Limibacter armeniacum TaxID=466084 RepID=UPI002FE59EBC